MVKDIIINRNLLISILIFILVLFGIILAGLIILIIFFYNNKKIFNDYKSCAQQYCDVVLPYVRDIVQKIPSSEFKKDLEKDLEKGFCLLCKIPSVQKDLEDLTKSPNPEIKLGAKLAIDFCNSPGVGCHSPGIK